MMNDPGQVRAVAVHERGEHPLVQRHQPRGRHRADDRAAGQLVLERDPAGGHGEQAALLGFGQRRGRVRHDEGDQRVDQPPLRRGRDHRQLFQHILGGRVEPAHPGQHRVGDRGRHLLALRRGEQFMHEEGIARGSCVKGAGT
jgi:hypothetical protein